MKSPSSSQEAQLSDEAYESSKNDLNSGADITKTASNDAENDELEKLQAKQKLLEAQDESIPESTDTKASDTKDNVTEKEKSTETDPVECENDAKSKGDKATGNDNIERSNQIKNIDADVDKDSIESHSTTSSPVELDKPITECEMPSVSKDCTVEDAKDIYKSGSTETNLSTTERDNAELTEEQTVTESNVVPKDQNSAMEQNAVCEGVKDNFDIEEQENQETKETNYKEEDHSVVQSNASLIPQKLEQPTDLRDKQDNKKSSPLGLSMEHNDGENELNEVEEESIKSAQNDSLLTQKKNDTKQISEKEPMECNEKTSEQESPSKKTSAPCISEEIVDETISRSPFDDEKDAVSQQSEQNQELSDIPDVETTSESPCDDVKDLASQQKEQNNEPTIKLATFKTSCEDEEDITLKQSEHTKESHDTFNEVDSSLKHMKENKDTSVAPNEDDHEAKSDLNIGTDLHPNEESEGNKRLDVNAMNQTDCEHVLPCNEIDIKIQHQKNKMIEDHDEIENTRMDQSEVTETMESNHEHQLVKLNKEDDQKSELDNGNSVDEKTSLDKASKPLSDHVDKSITNSKSSTDILSEKLSPVDKAKSVEKKTNEDPDEDTLSTYGVLESKIDESIAALNNDITAPDFSAKEVREDRNLSSDSVGKHSNKINDDQKCAESDAMSLVSVETSGNMENKMGDTNEQPTTATDVMGSTEKKKTISTPEIICKDDIILKPPKEKLENSMIMDTDSNQSLAKNVGHSLLEKSNEEEKENNHEQSSKKDLSVQEGRSGDLESGPVYTTLHRDNKGKVVTENEESECSSSPLQGTSEDISNSKDKMQNGTIESKVDIANSVDIEAKKVPLSSKIKIDESDSLSERSDVSSVESECTREKNHLDDFNPLQYCENKDELTIAMKSPFDNCVVETKYKSLKLSQSKTQYYELRDSKSHVIKQDNLEEIKSMLYLEFLKENKGKGSERLFSLYWEKMGRYLSRPLSSSQSHWNSEHVEDAKEDIENFLSVFLKSRSLRKIHNKLILAIMKSSLQGKVSQSKVKRHAPNKWMKKMKKKRRLSSRKTILDQNDKSHSNCIDDSNMMKHLDSRFGLNSDVWLNPAGTVSTDLSNFQSAESLNLNFSAPDLATSTALPGALFIDPTVKQLVKQAEMNITKDAVQCIVLAVRKHTSDFLKEVISHVEKEKKTRCKDDVQNSCKTDPSILSSQVIGEVLANNPKLGGGAINSSLSRLGWERCSRHASRPCDKSFTSFVNRLNASITSHIISKQPKIEFVEPVQPSRKVEMQTSHFLKGKSSNDSEASSTNDSSAESQGRGRGVKDLSALKASGGTKPAETNVETECDETKTETSDDKDSVDEEPKKPARGRGFGSKNLSALRKRSLTSGTESSSGDNKSSVESSTSSDKKEEKDNSSVAGSPTPSTTSNIEQKERKSNKAPAKRRKQQRRNAMVPKHRTPPQYPMSYNQPTQFQRTAFPIYQHGFNQASLTQMNAGPSPIPVIQPSQNIASMARQNQNNGQSQDLMRLHLEQQRHFNNGTPLRMPNTMNPAFPPMRNVPTMNMTHVSHLQNGNQPNILIQPQQFQPGANQTHGPPTVPETMP